MRQLDLSPARLTSVTLRSTTRNRLKGAVSVFAARQLPFSEQRLMRECLRLALKFWRGHKEIAERNKKYNQRKGPYEIAPFYSTEALRRVSSARCHHAGISLSRLMDFAITCYLSRVMEIWLSGEYWWRDKEDIAFWRRKYDQRRNRRDFLISYISRTVRNDGMILEYREKTTVSPWPPDLTPLYGKPNATKP